MCFSNMQCKKNVRQGTCCSTSWVMALCGTEMVFPVVEVVVSSEKGSCRAEEAVEKWCGEASFGQVVVEDVFGHEVSVKGQ